MRFGGSGGTYTGLRLLCNDCTIAHDIPTGWLANAPQLVVDYLALWLVLAVVLGIGWLSSPHPQSSTPPVSATHTVP
jgi:hypothetical protein